MGAQFKGLKLIILMIAVTVGSQAFGQKADITGKPDDGLNPKADMTLLKDGSEKPHKVKPKATPSAEETPKTKGLPTDVD